MFLIRFGIAIIRKFRIVAMHRSHPLCVFDRAPMLFGASGDFRRVGQQSIAISTINAVQLFQSVEVGQVLAVEGDVIIAPDLLNSVDRKANGLVEAYEYVQQNKRHDHRIDHRRRKDDHRTGPGDIRSKLLLDRGMLPVDIARENDLAVLKAITELPATAIKLGFELILKLFDAFDHLCNFVRQLASS